MGGGTRSRPGSVSSTEVARLAGVSRSAVSRAFTPGAYIAPETRAKVMRAAELLHYSPNAFARGLSQRRSGLIGIIASSLDNPFYALMLSALSRGLQAQGLGVHLLISEPEGMDALIAPLLSYQVDGVILPAVTLSSTMASALQRARRPVVLVNRTLDHETISSVSGDNLGGGRAVADLLAKTGCRHVAYMAGEADTSSSRDRGLGLELGLASHGLPLMRRDQGGFCRSADPCIDASTQCHLLRQRHHGHGHDRGGSHGVRTSRSGRPLSHRLRQHRCVRVAPLPSHHRRPRPRKYGLARRRDAGRATR